MTFLRYNRNNLIQDLLAGATGAVAGAPQAMGFAIIAGISPLYGLYTAVVATLVGTIVGSSTYVTVAPTNTLALVAGSALLQYTGAGKIEALFVLTFLVGVFQLAFGILRLGRLTRFVSNAVLTGFISGAGILIILGQLEHLTGYHAHGSRMLTRFVDLLTHLTRSDPQTTIVGIGAVAIIYGLHHTRYRSIATLVAILVTSVFITVAGWDQVALVRDMSSIPSGLPALNVPDLGYVPGLLSVAFAIAVLASVQSAALTNSIQEPDGSTPDLNRDLSAQGLGNLAGAFFQSMPSCGSLSRTAVNISAGAKTKLANLFAALLIAIILVGFGDVIEKVTLAALAGHLVVAASRLINVEALRLVWTVGWMGRSAMLLTLVSTLVLPLEYSIYLGVLLSLSFYVYTSASAVRIRQLTPTGNGHFRESDVPRTLPDHQVTLITVEGHLFFAAVKKLEELLPSPKGAAQPVVILRLRNNPYLGSTGIRFLEQYAEQLARQGGTLVLSGVGDSVKRQLEHTGALEILGRDKVFYANEVYFAATESALQYAGSWLQLHTNGNGFAANGTAHANA